MINLALIVGYRLNKVVEVDYDADHSGVYRAKSTDSESLGAKTIKDTEHTKTNTPFELIEAKEVPEEDGFFDATISGALKRLALV